MPANEREQDEPNEDNASVHESGSVQSSDVTQDGTTAQQDEPQEATQELNPNAAQATPQVKSAIRLDQTRQASKPQASARLTPKPTKKDAYTIALLPKQELFVRELIANGGWKGRAAIAAGYSPTSAHAIASQLLAKPEIQARIRQALDASTITPEETIGILALQARGDIADLLDENGEFCYKTARKNRSTRNIKKLKTIKRVTMTQEGPVETIQTDLEIYSAQDAAARLATIQGIDQEARKNTLDAEKERLLITEQVQKLAELLECSDYVALGRLREWKPEWKALAEYELPAVDAETVE